MKTSASERWSSCGEILTKNEDVGERKVVIMCSSCGEILPKNEDVGERKVVIMWGDPRLGA